MDIPGVIGKEPPSITYKCERALHFLSVIALLAIAYLGQILLIPILISAFIALFALPMVNLFMQLRLSKPLASLVVVILLVVGFSYLCSILIEPSLRWIEAVPDIGQKLLAEVKKMIPGSSSLTSSNNVDQAVSSTLFSAASAVVQTSFVLLMQIAAVIIMTYFFLAYGEQLMRSVVKAQDSFSEKKLTVVIFNAIRQDVTMYVLIVSLINIGLGLVFAIALKLIGFEDVILWGTLAAILNFAPYVGPLILAVILTLVGFTEAQDARQLFLAPGIFLLLNFIEGQLITPTLLGKRFNMNPLLVVLWMTLWGWLWGIAGVLLAIPMLMCFKIISTHVHLIGNWIEVLNGDATVHEPEPHWKSVKYTSLFAIFTKKIQLKGKSLLQPIENGQ